MSLAPSAHSVPSARLRALTPHSDDLLALGKFADDNQHAISFYYRPGDSTRGAHDAMLLNFRVRDIISNSFSPERRTSGLLRDLDHCLEIAEQTPEEYPCLRAVFACHDRGIWMEFEVPSSVHLVRVETGSSFNLGPLLRALEQQESFVAAESDTVKVV